MGIRKFVGDLAVANPSNPQDEYEKSVFFITSYDDDVVVSFRINQTRPDTNLSLIARDLGIKYYRTDPVYIGGNYSTNKIHMIHSLDWKGISTVPITKDIGITQDISILVALAENDGPQYYKACAGYEHWDTEVFKHQLSKKVVNGIPHKWEIVQSSLENMFLIEDDFIWGQCLQTSIVNKVQQFF